MQPAGEGAFAANPNPITAVRGEKTSYELSGAGVTAGTRYLGLVQYGESAVSTIVTVGRRAAQSLRPRGTSRTSGSGGAGMRTS